MNIPSEIFPSDGSNSSDHFFFNTTEKKIDFETSSLVGIITILFGLPTNSYVIWLIVTGKGNGLATEFFNLNLAVCEILIYPQPYLVLISYTGNLWILTCFLEALTMTGRPLFQCLICVERYLAVVHPVTFLKYKPLRYRVICSVIVWVAGFSSGWVSVVILWFILYGLYFIFFLVQFLLFLSIQLFCSVAVLRALKQSGPGERGRERKEENHMKRRAFYFILITTVTTVITYIPVINLSYFIWTRAETPNSLFVLAHVFFTSSGLVQPLLFLYRVGKLPFINYQ